MKIGIIGMGMVGEAVAYGLKRIGHTVLGYDKDPEKGHHNYLSLLQSAVIFICVPTPTDGTNKCDISIVEEVIRVLKGNGYKGLIAIKSTVPPGTTDYLIKKYNVQIAFCPEFLRERARFYDFYENMELCIAGVSAGSHYAILKQAHGSIPKNFIQMTPTEAELAKYFVNCFNAHRINFANAFYDVCGVLGADYRKIKDAVSLRSDTKSAYLESNENFREFGGACLPKDTAAFATFVHKLGLYTGLFANIVNENDRVAKGYVMYSDSLKVENE